MRILDVPRMYVFTLVFNRATHDHVLANSAADQCD